MPKPRLLIIVRHAQSEGNKNREIHQAIPDHRVKLTQDGWQQAYDAGRRLRALLKDTDTLQIFTSPYRRTRETTEGILTTLTADEPEGSPFTRENIKVYEEPRLREQDFGNFQPCSAEMERMWQERADYGHFFYRIPNGESAADAYDRVSGFNESLWRQFGEEDFASVCVLVTHGLMSRVFLMKWYHYTVEHFEDLRNINHCEFLTMRLQENGKYKLETKLRTWSELRRERALKESTEQNGKDSATVCKEPSCKDASKLNRSRTFVATRRWGGCPNGCDHSRDYKRRDSLEIDRQKDEKAGHLYLASAHAQSHANTDGTNGTSQNGQNGHATTIASRRPAAKARFHALSSDDEPLEPGTGDGGAHPKPRIDLTRAREAESVSSPDGTPSFISAEDRVRAIKSPYLHVGRDFGGTYSGHASITGSEDEVSDDDHRRRRHTSLNIGAIAARMKSSLSKIRPRSLSRSRGDDDKFRKYEEASGMGRGAQANRLGDTHSSSDAASDPGNDGDAEDEVIKNAEREERSVKNSVY